MANGLEQPSAEFCIGAFVKEDDEFIAAESCNAITHAYMLLKAFDQRKQGLIPVQVSIGIVDLLEVVDIDQGNGEGLLFLAGLVKQLFKLPSVEQTGKAVGT